MRKVMDPTVWGNSLWQFLHILTYNYTIDKQRYYKTFFNNLSEVLPCIHCRNFHKEYQQKHPIKLKSREELVKWLYLFHNAVNDKLRGQGNDVKKNPSLKQINKKYSKLLKKELF